MADRLAATRVLETKMDWLKGQDRRKGKERERGKEGGKGLEVLNGVPRLPPAKDSLTVIWAVSTRGLPRRIPEYWLHLSLSPCPHSTSPPPPSRPRQWIKELVYGQQKSEQRRAEGRHFLETVANNSGELVSVSRESGRKAGNWPSFYLHCKWSADGGAFTASSSYASLSSLTGSINKLQPRLLGPPVNITSECG